jgi:hypothetical protein
VEIPETQEEKPKRLLGHLDQPVKCAPGWQVSRVLSSRTAFAAPVAAAKWRVIRRSGASILSSKPFGFSRD